MAINFASYTRSKIDSERSFLYREHVFLPESKITPVKTLKTNTSLRENGFLPKDGERSPRENSVGANWRTSKPADKSGTERPRFLRQTVLLSTTLYSHPPPPLSIFRLDRPPAAETSRDCKKISPVNQLFPSFLLVCCPPVLYGRDRKATITKPNVTKLRRRRKGEHPPLALLVYRRANIRAPYIRMYGRICRNRARVLPTICVFCRNRKDMGSGISVSGSCLIRQNRSNLLVVVVVIHCGEDFQDTCLLEVV